MTAAERIAVPVHVTDAQAAAIPAALREAERWVCARLVREGERLNKIPVCATTGAAASSTDPATWAPFAVALARARRDRLALGYVLAAEDGLVAVDFDHVRDPATGEVEPWVAAYVSEAGSYAEASISGSGVHVIIRGEKPAGRCKRGQTEMYATSRYIVVTGDALPESTGTVAHAQAFIDALYRDRLAEPERTAAAALPPIAITADAEEILRRCEIVPRFAPLWAGDTGPHGGDHSAADLSLVSLLAWAGADERQADDLFRASGLMRPKWDERRGALTYGERTIRKAFDDLTARWEPPWTAATVPLRSVHVAARADDAPLPDDIEQLKGIIRELTHALDAERAVNRALAERVTTLSDLQSRNAAILRNRSLGAERQTAVAVGNLLANRETAERTPDGMHPVYLAAVAEAAGVSTDAAARHLDRLAEMGTGLRKETRTVRTERGVEKRVYIGLEDGSNVIDFAAAVAAIRPDTPRNGWGGRRVTCAACGPDTPVLKRTEFVCTGCGEVLEERREIVKPQDAVTGDEAEPIAAAADIEAGPGTVLPQDAVTRTAPVADASADPAAVLPQDAVTGEGAPSSPPVDVLGCRAESEHDRQQKQAERASRRAERRRADARRLLDTLRLRGADPHLTAGALVYAEERVGERTQAEVVSMQAEVEELLHAEMLAGEIRREGEATRRPSRPVFGQGEPATGDRWTDPAMTRTG